MQKFKENCVPELNEGSIEAHSMRCYYSLSDRYS